MYTRVLRMAGLLTLTTLLASGSGTGARADDVKLEEKSPSQKQEQLIWNVNREISGFRVEILEGNPIINTIKFLGDEEFRVGSYFSKGQSWEKRLDQPRQVGQLRVNVDKAQGSRLRLVLFTHRGSGGGESRSGAVSSSSGSVKRPSSKKESLIWDVNSEIRGFEVFVREGRPIINTVKILGGEEFNVGAYIDVGHSYRKDFSSPVRVGQLRVNVDKAEGSALELKLYR